MKTLRPGDIVTLKARVTDVAAYDDGQQIMVKLLPGGKTLGWLLQKETGFEAHELKLKVGDNVKNLDQPHDVFVVKAVFEDDQYAVQKRGNWPVQIARGRNLERI